MEYKDFRNIVLDTIKQFTEENLEDLKKAMLTAKENEDFIQGLDDESVSTIIKMESVYTFMEEALVEYARLSKEIVIPPEKIAEIEAYRQMLDMKPIPKDKLN